MEKEPDELSEYQINLSLGWVYKINNQSHFYLINNLKKPEYTREDSQSWKIYISLDADKQNIIKAWQIVQEKVINHELAVSKCLRKNYQNPDFQAGKVIILYHQDNVNWQNLLSEISESFTKQEINPGFIPINSGSISGSSFFYQGCDASKSEYVNALEREKIDFSNSPYKSINIEDGEKKPAKKVNNSEDIINLYNSLHSQLEDCSKIFFNKFPELKSSKSFICEPDFIKNFENFYDSNDKNLTKFVMDFQKIYKKISAETLGVINAKEKDFNKIKSDTRELMFDLKDNLKKINPISRVSISQTTKSQNQNLTFK